MHWDGRTQSTRCTWQLTRLSYLHSITVTRTVPPAPSPAPSIVNSAALRLTYHTQLFTVAYYVSSLNTCTPSREVPSKTNAFYKTVFVEFHRLSFATVNVIWMIRWLEPSAADITNRRRDEFACELGHMHETHSQCATMTDGASFMGMRNIAEYCTLAWQLCYVLQEDI